MMDVALIGYVDDRVAMIQKRIDDVECYRKRLGLPFDVTVRLDVRLSCYRDELAFLQNVQQRLQQSLTDSGLPF